MDKPKILVVVGATASGKTGLAIELAKRFDGEVVSADSRQVYKGLDIGSAKVTKEEMGGVTHHLLDVADPKDIYTAADFERDASKAIEDILSRNRLPIIAGGTFFYIDALLGRATLPSVTPNDSLRASLEGKSAAELITILEDLDPERASTIDPQNSRRLIRAIEIAKALGKVPKVSNISPRYNSLTIGISVEMNSHGETIKKRLLERLDQGMVAEVEKLLENGVSHERLENLGLEYRYVSLYLRGLIDYNTMIDELSTKIRQYAKRQMTWLKRDQSIHWYQKNDGQVFDLVKKFLIS